jgi:hypothetical protein
MIGAFLYETTVRTGADPGKANSSMGIARGNNPPGGVLCVCGNKMAQ